MFTKLGKNLAAAALLSFAAISSASALTVDTFLGSADLRNSGERTELAEINRLTGLSLRSSGNVGVNATTAMADAESGLWVINVGNIEPGYFLLKFGTGGSGVENETYFFQNIGELDKLVFSNKDVKFLTGGCGGDNCNIGRLSHYALYWGPEGSDGGTGGTGGKVPEPATVTLLGLGLLGVAASRRKASKSKNA